MSGESKLNKKLLIGAVAVIAIALVAALAIFLPKSAEAKKLTEQLNLGEKYLSELNYEQAVVSYLAAIEIDPKNVDAYVGLADAYIAQGEYDEAIKVLEDALSELGEDAVDAEAIKNKLAEAEAAKNAVEVVPTAEPTEVPVESTPTPLPTATSTPVPTATSTPTPSPTSSPSPTPLVEKIEYRIDGDTITFYGYGVLQYSDVPHDVFENEGIKNIVIEGNIYKLNYTAFSSEAEKTVESITIQADIKTIERMTFSYWDNLREVALLSGVEILEDSAFVKNENLEKVTLGDGLKEIGHGVFSGCNKLTEIVIPDSVEKIDDSAFYYCRALENVSLGNGLVEIGEWAFRECSALTSIVIPESVTHIGEDAFLGCKLLSEISIPQNVTYLGKNAFTNTAWQKNQGTELVIVGGSLIRGIDQADIVIPEGVVRIDIGALSENTETISFPKSLVSIASGSLDSTKWYKNLPDNEWVIAGTILYDQKIPYGQKGVTGDIVLPEGITVVGESVFWYNKDITSVVIPEGVTIIEEEAFNNCDNLTNVVIPEGIVYIGARAFESCEKIEKMELPSSLMHIGESAFSSCSGMTELIFGKGIEELGESAFNRCTGLTKVELPESLVRINYGAFYECRGLTEIVLGNNIKEIEEHAFTFCTSLSELTLSANIEKIASNILVNANENIVIRASAGSYAETWANTYGYTVIVE